MPLRPAKVSFALGRVDLKKGRPGCKDVLLGAAGVVKAGESELGQCGPGGGGVRRQSCGKAGNCLYYF